MKLKLSELNPNPFKKQISAGKLNREQIDKIKSNIKELGFFGSLPVFKKDNKYFLIAGHHRTQALKEVLGKDYEVKVEVENYNEDQVFRGMVIENLTQRGRDFDETSDNVQAVEDYLKEHEDILKQLRGESPRNLNSPKGGNPYKDEITANDISEWLDKNTGNVLEKDIVIDYMNINHKLHPDLKKQVEKKHDKSSEERSDGVNFTQAVILARIEDKKEQKALAKVLKETREQRVREQAKLITCYKESPEDIRKKIIEGKVDLADIKIEIEKREIPGSNKIMKERTALHIGDDLNSNLNQFKYLVDELEDCDNIYDITKSKANSVMTTLGLHTQPMKRLFDILSKIGAKPHPLIIALRNAKDGK